jgi:ribosomal protein S18 acetylase RimI-like enzyme
VVQPAGSSSLTVQPAHPEDFPDIARLTVGVYVDGELATAAYTPQLADVAGRASRSDLLVARDGAGRIVGSVALVLSGDFGEVTTSDEEAAFRMLVVDPAARGQGIGELLVTTCLERARAAGKRRMVISTDPRMTAAHRLYERMGFRRLAERDWSPMPGVDLLVYSRDL